MLEESLPTAPFQQRNEPPRNGTNRHPYDCICGQEKRDYKPRNWKHFRLYYRPAGQLAKNRHYTHLALRWALDCNGLITTLTGPQLLSARCRSKAAEPNRKTTRLNSSH